jgi:hypothetical protein
MEEIESILPAPSSGVKMMNLVLRLYPTDGEVDLHDMRRDLEAISRNPKD